MLGLAVAAVIGALFGPFSVVVPVVAHGLLWLAGVRASADDSDARALVDATRVVNNALVALVPAAAAAGVAGAIAARFVL